MGKKYAILCAVEKEIRELRAAVVSLKTITHAGSEITIGKIGNNEVAIMLCGVGKVSAAIGCQVMIDTYSPDYVINSGSGGALSEKLDVYDIVLSTTCVEHDIDATLLGSPAGYIQSLGIIEMKANDELRKKIKAAIPDDIHVEEGIVASGDQFIASNEQRQKILKNWPNAKVAEMEGAAIAHTCVQNKVPFCILRCISDNANGDSGIDYWDFAPISGARSAHILIDMLSK